MADKKVVLVTGGGRGLGAVVVRVLAARGHVVYCASRSIPAAATGDVRFLELDLASDLSCNKAVEELLRKENKIDVLINNAGITLSGPSLEFSAEDFERILQVNLIGPFRMLKAAYSVGVTPDLVINVTSLNGFMSFPNFGLYCASKFAVEALGLALRHELAASTKVVNVAPGALDMGAPTKMGHKPARKKIPFLNWLMPLTYPEDVAGIIAGLIDAPSVPPRVLVGRDAKIINMLQRLLPLALFDGIVGYIWRKK